MYHPLNALRSLLGSKYLMFIVRVVLAFLCFAIALVLAFIPGPAFLFWIIGFMLLGFSIGQILFAVKGAQDWAHHNVPLVNRLPRLKGQHIRAIMRHRWIQWLDSLSQHREARRERRQARRLAKAARRAGASTPTAP